MAQFLFVQGTDAQAVRDLYDRGLAAFRAIHGCAPAATAGEGTMRAAHFARRLVAGGSIARGPDPDEWALAAGTWVTEAGGAPETALRKVGAAILADGDPAVPVLRALDGYFVVVAANGRLNEAAILTDRVGALHAYSATHAGCILVSTSSLVLAALTGAAIDPLAVREVLAAHSVFEQRSLWTGIEKLPEATCLRVRNGRVVARRRWWSLAATCFDRAPGEPSPRDLAQALVESVRMALTAHPKPVFDLTGGFDSRILVAAALRTGLPFSTVVNGAEGDENVVAANRIAAAFGFDHRNQVPRRDFREPEFEDFAQVCALGDGEANVFDYAATLLAHTNLAKRFDLAVNGSWGEVCRGYWWDTLSSYMRTRRFDPQTFAAQRFPGTAWADRIAAPLRDGAIGDHFTGVVARSVGDLDGHLDTAKADAVYVRVRMQRWHGRIASMIARLRPTVAPFAFRGPLEIALAMHPSHRRRGACARHVVEILDRRLAEMPLANGAAATPIRLTNLPSHAPHFAELTRRAFRRVTARRAPPAAPAVSRAGDVWRLPEIADALDPAAMQTRAFYEPSELRALVETCRRDRSAPPSTLGRVVSIELAARVVAAARLTLRPAAAR